MAEFFTPVSAAVVAAQSVRLAAVAVDGGSIYWLESRPGEGGRVVLVRRDPDGHMAEVTPPEMSVRTRVHEYGGGAYLVSGGTVWCSNFADQRIYRLDAGAPPVPITPAGPWRYADAALDAGRGRLICVREDHSAEGHEAVSTLVAIPARGNGQAGEILVSGHDFYSTPRVSPDGSALAWLAWRHPQMPWDGTELWVARIDPAGTLREAMLVAGGPDESIYQPGWSPEGTLHFVSDRDGWWQIYRRTADHAAAGGAHSIEPVVRNRPPDSEFGRPHWIFGTATWSFAGPSRLVVSYTTGGRWRLATVSAATGALRDLPTPFEPADWIATMPGQAIVIGASARTGDAVLRIDLESGAAETLRVASSALPAGLEPTLEDVNESRATHDDHSVTPSVRGGDAAAAPALETISTAESVSFQGRDGETVHVFYYAPRPASLGLPPPLVVIGHGGPTTAARATLDWRVQYWTSRGFAVADVNYRGSSGYGRAYRQRLHGQWGVVDVADLVDAAQHLVREGRADARRLVIRGGSAGGFTALAALAFHPGVFAAAASYYGVSDLEALARDTHKFESRYLDGLVGPYPAARDTYRARSPMHAADRINAPLILFQGLDDRVVPPDQSERMAGVVRANGWPVTYLAFEGEQHGFRNAATIARCLDAELAFYLDVFRT